MSERLSAADKHRIECITTIGKTGLQRVDKKYGRGYLEERGSHRDKLSYHNGHHGRAVGSAALKLCADIDPVRRALAEAAGYWHDEVFTNTRGTDEQASAQHLQEVLQRNLDKDFPEHLIQLGGLAIAGTEPLFNSNFVVIGQKVNQLKFKNKADEHVAKAVASADFGELFAPIGPLNGHLYYEELHHFSPNKPWTPDDLVAFQRGQVALLESYRYPLQNTKRILGTDKTQKHVVDFSHGILNDLVAGTLETFDEVIQRDIAFMKKHS